MLNAGDCQVKIERDLCDGKGEGFVPDRKKQVPHTRQERDTGSSHFPLLLVLAIFLAAIVVKLLLPEFEAAVCYLLMGPEGGINLPKGHPWKRQFPHFARR